MSKIISSQKIDDFCVRQPFLETNNSIYLNENFKPYMKLAMKLQEQNPKNRNNNIKDLFVNEVEHIMQYHYSKAFLNIILSLDCENIYLCYRYLTKKEYWFFHFTNILAEKTISTNQKHISNKEKMEYFRNKYKNYSSECIFINDKGEGYVNKNFIPYNISLIDLINRSNKISKEETKRINTHKIFYISMSKFYLKIDANYNFKKIYITIMFEDNYYTKEFEYVGGI